jgi:GrpB-like predicted nucleotidyltransferase (UPF0157 family)
MALRFSPTALLCEPIELARRPLVAQLEELLPLADLVHVGSSSIEKGWTNGVLDLQVRVLAEEMAEAEALLAALFAPDPRHARGPGFVPLADGERGVAVQLTVVDGPGDLGRLRRERLLDNPLLRDRYDAIKRRHQGGAAEGYEADKRRFWEELEGRGARAS